MPPKTERMELRLDPDLIERIDEWRAQEDDVPSRSEAARRLVEAGLGSNKSEHLRLDKYQRLTTWMLSEILKNQYQLPKTASFEFDMKTVNLIQGSIFGGHEWALDWEMVGVLHNHYDKYENVKQVTDILDMWWFIETSYAKMSGEEKEKLEAAVGFRGKNPRFMGFDGNNESEHMSIARFLVEELGRFQDFKGRDFNSHIPTVSNYLRMARAFDMIRPSLMGRVLNYEEMLGLLNRDY